MLYLVIPCILGIISYIIYIKNKISTKVQSNSSQYDHAIVIGGSIGGMVTAAYLTKYFSRITIIESDDVLNDKLMKSTPEELLDYRCHLESPASIGRTGVPQIYQAHLMATEGLIILRELFPQLENNLINEHNTRMYSLKNGLRFIIKDILLNQNLTENIEWLGIDRFTLEIGMRKELSLQFGNKIEWKCNSKVTQLIVGQSLNIVKGIKYRSKKNIDSSIVDLYGDFIIDCSGRNSSSIKWLKQDFNLTIPTEQIHFGCGYLTFTGERFKTGNPSLDSVPIIGHGPNVPHSNAGCFITPMRTLKTMDENSLGILSSISIVSNNSEYPPSDSYENLLEWIKEKLPLEYYTILKSTKVCSPLISYNRAIDHRKYVELLGKTWPANFVLLGDAMCTFNPQFGQGMTHACRQARELGKIFQANSYKLKDISHIYNNRASAISNECWLASTASDWKTATLKVIKTDQNGETKTYQRDSHFAVKGQQQLQIPLLIKFMEWYTLWFLRCASKSGELSTEFLHVVGQHKSPLLLFKPSTILAVCQAALSDYFGVSKQISV